MKKLSCFNILICTTVIFSYMTVTLFDYSAIINILLATITLGISFLWIIKTNENIPIKKFIIIYLSIILILISRKANLISIALLAILALIAEKSDIKNSIKVFLKINIICFILVLASYFIFKFNKSCDTTIWRITANAIFQRYSLGFEHANQAMFCWFGIALGFLSLSNKKNVFKISIAIGGITFFIYKLTVSRTAMLVIYLVIILLIVFRNILEKKLPNILKILLGMFPIILSFISFMSIYLQKYEYLNSLFSGRFALYRQYFDIAGFNLFGNEYIEKYAMLDNSYLHTFLSKGIIFSFIYLIFMYCLIRKAKNITICDSIIILGYFISGFTETILFKFNLIILIIIVLYRHKISFGGEINGHKQEDS